MINAKLSEGLSVNNWISTHTPLKFFNLTQMEILIEEEYAMIALTPQFDHRAVQDVLFTTNFFSDEETQDLTQEFAKSVLSEEDIRIATASFESLKQEA